MTRVPRRILAATLLSMLVAVALPGSPVAAQPAASVPSEALYSKPALYTVKISEEIWHDDARNRDVPVRIYLPQTGGGGIAISARHPVIVLSHGLGGSGTNYTYFGEHMASHGYLVIAPTHAGSDTAALLQWLKDHSDDKRPAGRGWLAESVNDPENLKQRPKDISFVIDQVGKREAFSAIADLSRIGVAGHSFGAYTAMAIGGMLVDLPDAPDTSFRDERVKAVLPMSPEGKGTMGIDEHSWDPFAAPVLFLTGTKDYGAGGRAAAWRREAFDAIRGQDAYLATIDGATHMTFSGTGGGDQAAMRERIRSRIREKIVDKGLSQPDPDEAAHLDIVRPLCLAFFDAYLNEDSDARAWLEKYAEAKHPDCDAEFRPAASK